MYPSFYLANFVILQVVTFTQYARCILTDILIWHVIAQLLDKCKKHADMCSLSTDLYVEM